VGGVSTTENLLKILTKCKARQSEWGVGSGKKCSQKMIYFTEIARKNSTLCQLICPAPKRPIPSRHPRQINDAASCIPELAKISIFFSVSRPSTHRGNLGVGLSFRTLPHLPGHPLDSLGLGPYWAFPSDLPPWAPPAPNFQGNTAPAQSTKSSPVVPAFSLSP